MYKNKYFCRWCGIPYRSEYYSDRDGFCCPAHKQAHHRAYKKYVTWKNGSKKGPSPVPQIKSRKKRKKSHG